MGKPKKLENLFLDIVQYLIILPAFFVICIITFVVNTLTVHIPGLFKTPNSQAIHAQKVEKIREQVLDWNKNGRKGKMCTARPSWVTVSLRNYAKNKMAQINLGNLEEIVQVDLRNKLLYVEPGIKMGALTAQLLPLGWTIPVIPEIEFLTVGGCICGAGLETSSHKYGLFSESALSFEVVLADGRLIRCSKEENKEIFYSIGMSHGTIGFLVGVTFPLIPAARYVKLEYIPSGSVSETEKLLQAPNNEFIEGIMFDKSNAVVMYGNFADNPPKNSKINTLSRWYKPWFFKHVESFLSKPGHHIEYIPTRDYYHRHQRSLFWEMEVVISCGNNPIFRYLFGWLLPLNFQALKFMLPVGVLDLYLHRNQHLIQDFILPVHKLKNALDFNERIAQIYPIWLCPVVLTPNPGMTHSTGNRPEMFMDIGIYGNSQKDLKVELKEVIKKFEQFTLDNKGFQGLYADNYLSKDDFERMFDVRLYEKLRNELKCADAFPHAYDKVSHVARKL